MFESETYHLVCRECDEELLAETATEAEQHAADHEALTGHRLAFKQVV